MHEAALMQSVLDTVERVAKENGITKIKEIHLIVGKRSGALVDALRFAYDCVSTESFCSGAVLYIEERDLVVKCNQCNTEYAAEEPWDPCPECRSFGGKSVQGTELAIDFFEGDEGD